MENHDEYRKNYVKNESPRVQRQYLNIFKGKSKAKAVGVKCLDCCCFQPSEAADCRVPSCPLYNVNPYRIARLKREAKHSNLREIEQHTATKGKDNENQDNDKGKE